MRGLLRAAAFVTWGLAVTLGMPGCGKESGASSHSPYCPGSDPTPDALDCRSSDDCQAGMSCVPPAATKTAADVAAWRPLIVAPPPPCTLPTCFDDSGCPDGSICEPSLASCSGMMTCVPRCQCAPDERCKPDGRCEVIPCNETGGSCPAYTRCAPGEGDPGGDPRTVSRGCVRIPCNEPGGTLCAAGWRCDPANAPSFSDNPPWGRTAGCAAIPCTETGTCEGNLICYPGAASRAVSFFSNPFAELADGRWVDPYGCVQPNCEEGFECSPGQSQYYECLVGDPRADQFGCRARRCDEPGGFDCEAISSGAQWCAADLPQANVQSGCAPKSCQTGGYPCAAGEVCDFSNPAAARTGCVPAGCVEDPSSCPQGSGGAGGFGGAGSGGATGAGGSTGSAASPDGGAALGDACSQDDDCACGSCVLGACRPRPGTCQAL